MFVYISCSAFHAKNYTCTNKFGFCVTIVNHFIIILEDTPLIVIPVVLFDVFQFPTILFFIVSTVSCLSRH